MWILLHQINNKYITAPDVNGINKLSSSEMSNIWSANDSSKRAKLDPRNAGMIETNGDATIVLITIPAINPSIFRFESILKKLGIFP